MHGTGEETAMSKSIISMPQKKDILDPNPFTNPPFAPNGDDNERDIYAGVGFALHRWEQCEISFGVLYSLFVGATDGSNAVMRAFGAITLSSARREMIRHASDAFFGLHKKEDLQNKVRRMLKLYLSAGERRNDVAHAMVMGELPFEVIDNKAVPLPTVWFLVPPLFATKKIDPTTHKPRYRYSTRELNHLADCYEELHRRATELVQEIRTFRASLPKAN